MPAEIIVIGAVILVIVIIWYNISNQRDKRAGIGTWAAYGPNPTPERIAQVNLSRARYNEGISELARGRVARARALFEEAVELGNTSALTGIGIVEFYARDRNKAKGYWELAAAQGEVPAKMLLRLKKNSGVDFGRREFARIFVLAENTIHGRDMSAMHAVVGLALHFGYLEYARKMRDIANANTRSY